jgi:hypothetical protein
MRKPHLIAAGLTLAISAGLSTSLGADDAKGFQYQFAEAETNAFRVEIQSQSESGGEELKGVFVTSSKPWDTEFATVRVKGQFHPVPSRTGAPMYLRPGFVPLASLLAYSQGPFGSRESVIDSRGRLARTSNDLALPIPLGTLMSILFPELPLRQGANEREETVFIMDEPSLTGPAPAFPPSPYGGYGLYAGPASSRSQPGPMAAHQKTKDVMSGGGASVTLARTLTLATLLKTGSEPRISAEAEAKYSFDPEKGTLTAADWSGKYALVTEHISRRVTFKLAVQRIEGEELAKALSPPPPPVPAEERKISSDEAAALVAKMQSTDMGARLTASSDLLSRTPAELDDATRQKLASLTMDKEEQVRRAALKTLAACPRPSDLPILARGLEGDDHSIRTAVIRAIAGLKSPRAAAALADSLAAGAGDASSRNSEVVDALIQMGPLAEPAALPLLKERNARTLVDACRVLRDTGTANSVKPLKELVLHPSKNVSDAAIEALRVIRAREASEKPDGR